tara:strand:+ start:1121 stop:2446 length:1326 start_codon:yes stop_codon:yes gene_type:complete
MSVSKTKEEPEPHNLLDKLSEALNNSADANNKVKINEYKSPSYYLPSIGYVSSLLGLPSTQKQLMDLVETTYITPLEISRSSKYDLFNKGVGPKTVSKLIDWFKKLPLPIEQLANQKLMNEVLHCQKAGSNAGNWFAAIQNFEAGFMNTSNATVHEFEPLLDFIERRCNTEVDVLSDVRQKIKARVSNLTDLDVSCEVQHSLWSNSPCLSPHIIENVIQIIRMQTQQKNLTEQQTLTVLESYCYLSFDFYLEAISHYEVGCRLYYSKDQSKLEDELGMITEAINAYATDNKTKTCFDGMLGVLKDVVSEIVGVETGYRKLASFIEIEENESMASGESLEDKKYNQLKDWRNGLNLPSSKKLALFLQNLDRYAGTSSGNITWLMCRITMGMDKLVNDIFELSKGDNYNSDDVEVIIKNVLATMPKYHAMNLRKQLDKRKPPS